MPTIACPGCGKKYNVPATAAGQVAKCACGNWFKLAGSSSSNSAVTPVAASTVATTTASTVAASKPRKAAVVATAAPRIDEDFWDEALREETPKLPELPKPAAPPPSAASATSSGAEEKSPAKKKRKKNAGIKWGFDWGKVASGLLTFLIAGGITVALVFTTGRLYFWPAGIAIVGLFTALSGLMGEEGIW